MDELKQLDKIKEKKVSKSDDKMTLVVGDLPTFQSRDWTAEDGTEYHCVTVSEALTEILERVKKIEKVVG